MPSPLAMKSLYVASDQGKGLSLLAAECGNSQCRVRHRSGVDDIGYRLHLLDEGRSDGELPREQLHACPSAQGQRQDGERSLVAGYPNLAGGEEIPALVVPDVSGCSAGQPRPAQSLFRAHGVATERFERTLQDRGTRHRPVGDQQSQPVEQKIRSPGWPVSGWGAVRAAFAISTVFAPFDCRPANRAAVSASRYVSRALLGSSGSSR